jgi:hypothetical protein
VTAREATRKMVAAATQLDALQQVVARVDDIAAAHGIALVHMARPNSIAAAGGGGGAGGGGAGATGGATPAQHHAGHHAYSHHRGDALAAPAPDEPVREEFVPRFAAAVVAPNMWQPKNTIVRSTFREVSSQVVAQRAAGPLAAAAAVAPVAPLPVVQNMVAAAAAAAGDGAVTAGGRLPSARHSQPGTGAAAAASGGQALGMRFGSSGGGGGSAGSTPVRPPSSSSGGGGGRHSVPETPINCPMMVLEEGALPEDMLVAAMQQLAEAQTPRPTPATQRRCPHAGKRA